MRDPINPTIKRNRWFLIIVCITGIMIASLWVTLTPDGIMNKMDAVGYAVCHRISSHSFLINGQPMPLCARCSGMFLGALYGTVIQFFSGKRKGGISKKLLMILGALGLLFIVDGSNSFIGLILDKAPLYPPQNWLRMITGIGMGVLISAILYPIFTQTVWRTWNPESAFGSTGSKIALAVGSIVLIIALLSGNAIILYSLAFLSVLGVMALLTLIYSVVLLIIFRQENRYNVFRELIPALISGMVLMMLQIGLFDLVRFLLTETWSGLPL